MSATVAAARVRGPNALGARHIWTDAELADLRCGYKQGVPANELAARFGVTVRAIEGQASLLGIRHSSRTRTDQERFIGFIRHDDLTGCHIWIGAKNSRGRAQFRIGGGIQLAPRVALSLAGIQIPSGMLVCHHCDNPLCVNVDHLFIGSQLDNVRDCRRKGRLAATPSERTGTSIADEECLSGHPLAADNLYVAPDGQRMCRICRRAAGQRFRERMARQCPV